MQPRSSRSATGGDLARRRVDRPPLRRQVLGRRSPDAGRAAGDQDRPRFSHGADPIGSRSCTPGVSRCSRARAPPYDEVLDHVRSRLHRVPRYRQRLIAPPLGLGEAQWVDDPAFNLAYHVRHTGLPAPGDQPQAPRARRARLLPAPRPVEAAVGAVDRRAPRGRRLGAAVEGRARARRGRHARRHPRHAVRRLAGDAEATAHASTGSRAPRPPRRSSRPPRSTTRSARAGCSCARAARSGPRPSARADAGRHAARDAAERPRRPAPPPGRARRPPRRLPRGARRLRRHRQRRRARGRRRRAAPLAARARRAHGDADHLRGRPRPGRGQPPRPGRLPAARRRQRPDRAPALHLRAHARP